MNTERFNKVIDEQVTACLDTLVHKAKEYATDDRLHNFKTAAALKGETPRQALAGMMAKHTVSIFDMCKNPEIYPMAVWDEKIGDHLNYLLLLKAVVTEEYTDLQPTDV